MVAPSGNPALKPHLESVVIATNQSTDLLESWWKCCGCSQWQPSPETPSGKCCDCYKPIYGSSAELLEVLWFLPVTNQPGNPISKVL